MSEGKQRKVHRVGFNAKVGMEAVRGVKMLNEIGQRYGAPPVVVGLWKKEIVERAVTLFEGKRGPKPAEHADEERLYGEIGRLKMELDWLKKIEQVRTSPTSGWRAASCIWSRSSSGTRGGCCLGGSATALIPRSASIDWRMR